MLESPVLEPSVMDFPGHFQHMFKQLNQQRLQAQLCDCVVLVGAQTFHAHRSILAACSSHFRALLSSSDEIGGPGADQGGDGGPAVMTLDPEVVTPEAFSTLLDMIYTSTLSLGASNVMDVLLAASHLHLNTVVKACKLHLSRKNFPAAAPKGWRSVHQQQNLSSSVGHHQVTSVVVEDIDSDDEDIVVEVTQSSRDEGEEGSQGAAHRRKRKCQEDKHSDRKRTSRQPGEVYKECSPTVTRSSISAGDGDLLSPDSLERVRGLWENRNNEEVEKKYSSTKAESEEMQLPSQSDSSSANGGMCGKTEGGEGESVVKVKVGEEEEELQVTLVEVKKENLSTYRPDLDVSPPSPLQHCTASGNDEKTSTATSAEDGVSSLHSQLCTVHPDSGTQRGDEDLGEDSVDGEGLDSLSELAFSCFLNPSIDGVMGALEEEDSLASLTAAATAAAARDTHIAIAPTVTDQSGPKPDDANTSANDSSTSLVFPMASVPLQQLLPTPSFSDTIFLQPTQNPLTGFLSGIRSCLSLETTSKTGKSSGATTFRRIAPKVPPGAEPSSEASSGSAADTVDHPPPLTRASEDVLSKCKKAAAEDLVLLVEGEKKYACKICSKTFMNLTDCKKHIRVHTGEKPYPCPKCGKRFSQSSHLYKHSKNTCSNWKDSFSETM